MWKIIIQQLLDVLSRLLSAIEKGNETREAQLKHQLTFPPVVEDLSQSPFLTMQEAADRYKISTKTLTRFVDADAITHYKISAAKVIDPKIVDEEIRNNQMDGRRLRKRSPKPRKPRKPCPEPC